MNCPKCQSDRIIRSGLNASGTQRYECQDCRQRFTPGSKRPGRKVTGHAKSGAERQRDCRKRKREKEQK